MPLPSSRMTKQPVQPARYFPKAYEEDPVSEEEDSEEEDEEKEQEAAARAPAPKATSFPRKLAVGEVKPAPKAPESTTQDDLAGFETASESSEGEGEDSGSEEEEDDSSEEDSSDDELRKPMLRPTFLSKAKRTQQQTPALSDEQRAQEEERKRKEKADELLQAQIERDTAARKAGKKSWDDDDAPAEAVDDTDGLDPEAERAAWKLRELKRVQRDRQALIAKEKEREEVERRRNMTAEERAREDAEYLANQAEEREGKGKMNYMQKYFHKGAFFHADEQDEEVRAALNRDIAGRKFVDEAGDKTVLPEYMKMRDMTRLGKKGRTRYKDLQSEDTGRWGEFDRRRKDHDGLDDRFRPDERGDGGGDRTGANAAPVGERRRREDGDDARGGGEKRARHG